jgi:hypothetical protein
VNRTEGGAQVEARSGVLDARTLRHSSDMQTDAFEAGLRAFIRRAPFQPFTVELTSGTQFQVLHPEALAFSAGRAVYISPEGTPNMFDHESVNQLVGSTDSSAQANQAA